MRYTLAIAVGVAIGWSAPAAESAPAVARGDISAPDICLAHGFDHYSFAQPMTIPDGDSLGVLIGPIPVPNDGMAIEGVVLRVEVSHRSTPDLALRLCYDADCDGVPEASVALEPYLARRSACVVKERYGCPAALDGAYFFRDGYYARNDDSNRKSQGELRDPIDNGLDVSFTVFDGMRKGGGFYLAAVDSLPGDAGVVKDWTVFIRQPLYGALR